MLLADMISQRISEHAATTRLFAVVHIGGKQYKITADDIITIDKIDADVGAKIVLEKVPCQSMCMPRLRLLQPTHAHAGSPDACFPSRVLTQRIRAHPRMWFWVRALFYSLRF